MRKRQKYFYLFQQSLITSDQLEPFKKFVTGKLRLAKKNYHDAIFKQFKYDIEKTWNVINNFIRSK